MFQKISRIFQYYVHFTRNSYFLIVVPHGHFCHPLPPLLKGKGGDAPPAPPFPASLHIINRQFQLLICARRGWREVRYHIAVFAEKFQQKLPKQPKYFNIYKNKLSLRVYTAIFIFSA
jgi:hypothetical protein